MFLGVLCVLMLLLKPSISQFPQHTDLQKVGEVIFNNEKYNILKVTTHTVSDYFEDFMLGKKKPSPTKRLFVDDNSFSHQWSGFDKKSFSLRKTEIKTTALDTGDKDITAENDISESKENASAERGNSSNSVENVDKNENSLEPTTDDSILKEDVSEINKSGEKVTVNQEDEHDKTQTEKKELSDTLDENLRQGTQAKVPATDGKERTVVKTTFFCPFFGVITMSAFVD